MGLSDWYVPDPEGFCSVFLWCPGGTRVKYRLFVGSSVRAPDEEP